MNTISLNAAYWDKLNLLLLTEFDETFFFFWWKFNSFPKAFDVSYTDYLVRHEDLSVTRVPNYCYYCYINY